MPMGFAGRGTAGRLSGGGIAATAFFRLGLGEGFFVLALADGLGAPALESADSGVGTGLEPGAEGLAGCVAVEGAGVEGVVEGAGVGEVSEGLAAAGALGRCEAGGAPDGVTVHPATTPAHTRTPIVAVPSLIPSG
jgi:hypothetical protein